MPILIDREDPWKSCPRPPSKTVASPGCLRRELPTFSFGDIKRISARSLKCWSSSWISPAAQSR